MSCKSCIMYYLWLCMLRGLWFQSTGVAFHANLSQNCYCYHSLFFSGLYFDPPCQDAPRHDWNPTSTLLRVSQNGTCESHNVESQLVVSFPCDEQWLMDNSHGWWTILWTFWRLCPLQLTARSQEAQCLCQLRGRLRSQECTQLRSTKIGFMLICYRMV